MGTKARQFEKKYSTKCRWGYQTSWLLILGNSSSAWPNDAFNVYRFCGGKRCLRCSEQAALRHGGAAFKGLHSDWITDSILAMQRPSTRLIQKYDLISKLKSAQIRMIVNLTEPGEHPWCGDGLEPSSGFPYLPEDFMAHGIGFVNFAWEDMTTPPLNVLADIIRVMSSCIDNGGKVAVHCHAGYGRTGLVIASWLVFANRMSPSAAIDLVRQKRPGSVQTVAQQSIVQVFADFSRDVRVCYHFTDHARSTLGQYLAQQAVALPVACEKRWGKIVRWVPLPIHLSALMMEGLANSTVGGETVLNAILHACASTAEDDSRVRALQFAANSQEWSPWESILHDCTSSADDNNRLSSLQYAANSQDGSPPESEPVDPNLPAYLLVSWLNQLKAPAVSMRGSIDVLLAVGALPVGEVRTLARLVQFLRAVKELSAKDPRADATFKSACRALSQVLLRPKGALGAEENSAEVGEVELLPGKPRIVNRNQQCNSVSEALLEILARDWDIPKHCRPYNSIEARRNELCIRTGDDHYWTSKRKSVILNSVELDELLQAACFQETRASKDDAEPRDEHVALHARRRSLSFSESEHAVLS
jgi:hypothetical protein